MMRLRCESGLKRNKNKQTNQSTSSVDLIGGALNQSTHSVVRRALRRRHELHEDPEDGRTRPNIGHRLSHPTPIVGERFAVQPNLYLSNAFTRHDPEGLTREHRHPVLIVFNVNCTRHWVDIPPLADFGVVLALNHLEGERRS